MQLISAAELVRAATLLIHRQLPEDLFLHIEDIDDGLLLVDRDRMQQVFINLLVNAADAIGDRGGTISLISSAVQIDGKEYAQIEVIDTGCGIDQENVSKVFEPFFSTKGRGSGIGLAVVHRIITEHGGTLRIAARVFAGDLLLELSDDGPGVELVDGRIPGANGVGLRNTCERLQELYGGQHYFRLMPAQPTVGGADKIEVAETFMYSCPHCFTLEPYIQKWLETKDPGVRFVRIPAVFNRLAMMHAQTYYTAELLEKNGMIASRALEAIASYRERVAVAGR